MDTFILWIRIFVVGAAICATSVPVIYAFYPWRTRGLGKVFMLQAFTFAVTMDISALFSFWRPRNLLFVFIVDLLILLGIGVSTLTMALFIWKLNHPRKGRHWRK